MTFFETVAELAAEIPVGKMKSTARKIEEIPAGGVTGKKVLSAWGTAADKPIVKEFCSAAESACLSGKEIATALRAACETASSVKGEEPSGTHLDRSADERDSSSPERAGDVRADRRGKERAVHRELRSGQCGECLCVNRQSD